MHGIRTLLLALILAVALGAAPAVAVTNACWGQASAVFAQAGDMGEHASQQPTPRLGLANLARALYDVGAIEDPTMQALGAYVVTESGLSVEACGTD